MSRTDWEQHYQAGNTPWDKGAPSPGLIDFLQRNTSLARGSVLVPGCGAGHDVRAWSQHGFSATGIDLAPTAIEKARASTPQSGASYRQWNFLQQPAFASFDWIFEHTLYCAILPQERPLYAQAVCRWLQPGGCFLAVHYMIQDIDGPPFGVDRNEILSRFGSAFELISEWVPRSYPNRIGLERMFWWRKPGKL